MKRPQSEIREASSTPVTESRIMKYCQGLVPLKCLSDVYLQKVLTRAQLKKVHAGQRLFELDVCDGKHIYVLAGSVDLQFSSGLLTTLQAGDTQACFPLANEQPRNCRAIAATECILLQLDSRWLDHCLAWSQVLALMTPMLTQHLSVDAASLSLLKLLASDVFNSVPAANAIDVINHLQAHKVSAGELLCEQGQAASGAYFVIEGQAQVLRSHDGASVFTATLPADNCFAAKTLKEAIKYNASLTMLSDGLVMTLDREAFTLLQLQQPLAYVDFARLAASKDEFLLIDVRTREEYLQGHLPNALSVPLAELSDVLPCLPADKKAVFYCSTRNRAAAAFRFARQQGRDVSILPCGTNDNGLTVILETFNPVGFVAGSLMPLRPIF
ncbi:MAG: cyclic nucleotide-binding domain-containing protein [Marinagarivorans sp.]|nr:cyclic nucleotide-binding domain-containing protein [Marinagarivorans sp.]